MLSVALIANSNGDDARSPISHESFCSSVKDWFATNNFSPGSIYLERG